MKIEVLGIKKIKARAKCRMRGLNGVWGQTIIP